MIDTLITVAATVLVSFTAMIFLQWQDRRNILMLEAERHKNHLCTRLYDADLITAKDTELIQRELFRERYSTRNARLFALYHDNMIHVDWDREQLTRMAPEIRKITAQLKEGDMVNFHDMYGRVLLSHIRDDQLLGGMSAEDVAFCRKMQVDLFSANDENDDRLDSNEHGVRSEHIPVA